MPDSAQTLAYAVFPWVVLLTQMPWIAIAIELLIAAIAVLFLHRFGTTFLLHVSGPLPFSHRLVQYSHRPGAVVVFLLIAQIILRHAPDSMAGIEIARHLNSLCMIIALTWLGLRTVKSIEQSIIEMHPSNTPDNLQARRVQTQTKVLARSMMAMIIVIGSGAALMTLPGLRQIGTSLLASAGVAGLIVGFAAKPVLGNLLAGMQIALTQPIRLEDVVIIQGEWGYIEEITGTYVVVRTWDQRRLIVPLQWIIENPFQNWTRNNADILGTVLLWVDYRMPMKPLRDEIERICRHAPEWDGRLCQTQVVDAGERAMQIRVLVSAGNAGNAWDLRCRLREGLVDFIQRNYPEYLPRVRADVAQRNAPPA